AGAGLVDALLDAVTAPAEAALGGAGAATTKGVGDLGLEQAALVPPEPLGRRANQVVVLLAGMVHRGYPSTRWSDTLYKNPARAYPLPGSFPTAGRLNAWNFASLGHGLQLLRKNCRHRIRDVMEPDGLFKGGRFARVACQPPFGVDLFSQRDIF